jgi:putative membrane protein
MRAGRALRNPFAALVAHAAILWLWHFPAFYEAAIGHELLHALEHFAFVGSAFWFWTTIIPARRRSPAPVRILAVFGNLLQGGALGVLLLFASRSLYGVHAGGAAIWGLTPLEDQQLAGVLMWVPPGIVYFSVMAVLFARWLRQVETIMSARTSALETSRVSSGVSGRGADHA